MSKQIKLKLNFDTFPLLFFNTTHFFVKNIDVWIVFPGIMQQDNSEQVIIDPKLIAKHYIKTWSRIQSHKVTEVTILQKSQYMQYIPKYHEAT